MAAWSGVLVTMWTVAAWWLGFAMGFKWRDDHDDNDKSRPA